jgi:hypothetical protein
MRSALEVADIFRRHGAAYREAHGGHLSRGHRRVMGAIETCRSAALGGHVEQCNGCGQLRIAYNSCRNRHCPKCQGLARAQWLADRQSELLPVPYFHVVFTVPAPIAEIALHNKAAFAIRNSWPKFLKKYQTQSGFQVGRSELTPRYYRAEILRRPRHRRPRSTDALGP